MAKAESKAEPNCDEVNRLIRGEPGPARSVRSTSNTRLLSCGLKIPDLRAAGQIVGATRTTTVLNRTNHLLA